MSNHGLDTGEQSYDERHVSTPPAFDTTGVDQPGQERHALVDGDHIGNDHQEPTGFFRPEAHWTQESAPLPVRQPAQSFATPETVREVLAPGLSWQGGSTGPIRADLVNFDFGAKAAPHAFIADVPVVSNIELRTIYAHLLETAGRVRHEMRERGMQVDL